ncbi:MAG: hypothetical protein C5B51_17885 [Terriglobia bacterium]|nr:MAG: hypothetical protein C5B51_17885 [Terriglobia bacterium]
MANRSKTAAAFALILHAGLAAAQQPVPEAEDAYHFRYWTGAGHPADYTEWWYFNVYDSTNHLQAIFTYFVTNPANILGGGALGIGVAQMTSVVYLGGNIVTENDRYASRTFSAAYDKADVSIAANQVGVISPDLYQISGSSRDGRLRWALSYQRDADSWYAANRINVGSEPWELMSWLLYMPRAQVSGTLTVDGVTYNINAPGYHDHNWGEWNLTGVPWNWAQYSQPGLAFDLGDFPVKPGGIASVSANGQRYSFTNTQYTLTHTQWAFDPQNGIYYPTQSVFQADNGTAQVSVVMDVYQSDPLSSGLPPPSANVVIYEQTAHFTGQVSVHGGSSLSFAGDGFKEYTAIVP